jgi:hypothetical protein
MVTFFQNDRMLDGKPLALVDKTQTMVVKIRTHFCPKVSSYFFDHSLQKVDHTRLGLKVTPKTELEYREKGTIDLKTTIVVSMDRP